jgi:NhaP-type Na+/H+ or K+/H+ antiporter
MLALLAGAVLSPADAVFASAVVTHDRWYRRTLMSLRPDRIAQGILIEVAPR